jgi:hypothetical protein
MTRPKRAQIDTLLELQQAVEKVAIQLADLQGAFELIYIKPTAKLFEKASNKLFEVARRLGAIVECMVDEDAKNI